MSRAKMPRGALLSRAYDNERKADLRRQRALEREHGVEEHERVPRGALADRSDDPHEELHDDAPPGWARSEP